MSLHDLPSPALDANVAEDPGRILQDLEARHCVACEGGMAPLSTKECLLLIRAIPQWSLVSLRSGRVGDWASDRHRSPSSPGDHWRSIDAGGAAPSTGRSSEHLARSDAGFSNGGGGNDVEDESSNRGSGGNDGQDESSNRGSGGNDVEDEVSNRGSGGTDGKDEVSNKGSGGTDVKYEVSNAGGGGNDVKYELSNKGGGGNDSQDESSNRGSGGNDGKDEVSNRGSGGNDDEGGRGREKGVVRGAGSAPVRQGSASLFDHARSTGQHDSADEAEVFDRGPRDPPVSLPAHSRSSSSSSPSSTTATTATTTGSSRDASLAAASSFSSSAADTPGAGSSWDPRPSEAALSGAVDALCLRAQFANFRAALRFVNRIGQVAESEGHHPDVYIHDYNHVRVTLSTYAIQGLSTNDFILAAKISRVAESLLRGRTGES